MTKLEQAADAVLEKLKEINSAAYEASGIPHIRADEALLDFFKDIGRLDIVDEWEKVDPKWYE